MKERWGIRGREGEGSRWKGKIKRRETIVKMAESYFRNVSLSNGTVKINSVDVSFSFWDPDIGK